ncbi:MAG: helix-turn-helix domain-containing protein [Armatimonadota bacterium]
MGTTKCTDIPSLSRQKRGHRLRNDVRLQGPGAWRLQRIWTGGRAAKISVQQDRGSHAPLVATITITHRVMHDEREGGMPYNVRNTRPSVVHIPDVGLRIDPGQRVTVTVLSPQLTHLVAFGALVVEPAAPEPRPKPAPPEVPAPPVEQTAMRQIPSGHRNAAAVLPQRLLARVQRVVTGYVTIPPRVTLADQRLQAVTSLHRQGATPCEMAATLQVSRRHVTRLLRKLTALDAPPFSGHPLPAPLLAQVQQYVTGRLYVPLEKPVATRRRQMQRAFETGLSTTEIARRLRCSARHVQRERARWRDTQARAGEDPAHAVR